MVIQILSSESQVVFPVRVTPKGGSNCVLPGSDDAQAVRIKVSAAPEDGKANLAVLKVMAEVLELPKSCLQIVRGEKSREKQVGIEVQTVQEAEALYKRLVSVFGGYGYVFKRRE
jgi:uncharacterized protein (TIGR00251 family)